MSDETTTAVADEPQATGAAQNSEQANPTQEGNDEAELGRFMDLRRKHYPDADGDGDVESDAEASNAADEDTEDSETDSEDAEPGDSDQPPEGFDEALRALKRDGMTDEAIEALWGKDRDAFIKYGQSRAKAQKDQDRFGSEYRQWKAKQGASSGGGPAKPADTAQQATPSDANGEIDAIIESIKDNELYEDLAEPLQKLVTELRKETTRTDAYDALVTELATVRETNQRMAVQMVNTQLAIARNALSGRFPDMTDDTTFERVLGRYDKLAGTGEYRTVDECLADAAMLELGEKNTNEIKQKLLSNAKQRKAGVPRAKTAGTNKPISPEDAERAKFFEIRKKHYGKDA